MPEWLTRKLGPLPAWGWAALAGGGFIVFRYLKARQASSSTTPAGTSSNVTATVPDIPTASVTEPGGFSYTGPLGGLSQLMPTGAMSATSGSNFTPPTGESQIGGGFGFSPTQTQSLITSPTGAQFAQVPAGAATGGTQYYYQPEPGIFTAINPASPPGGPSTPWFQAIKSSA